MAVERVVVVGAGQAGVQVADSLRAGGFAGTVTVLGDEPVLPYQRPPLSKDHLAPEQAPDPLPLRAERFFVDNEVDLRTGVTATAVDRDRRAVLLDDGSELPYTWLVLATGAVNRTLPVPGTDLAGVHQLRTLAQADDLRRALDTARSIVVVGAGFIGLELAAVARRRGLAVTVLEIGPRAMGRAVSPETAAVMADAHRGMGTDLRLQEGLARLTGRDGSVTAAVGTSGTQYPADLVLVGAGVRPRDELARAAGLAVDDGIVVDEHLRTLDPAVYAVGDCARFPGAGGDAHLRLESVQNATDQGRHVAEVVLGRPADYAKVPWFWSHQGPMRLQIAGLSRPGDTTVLSGDPSTGRVSVFCFRSDSLVAVESLNRPADHLAARRVLASGDLPSPEQVAHPRFSLKTHAQQLAPAR